MRTNNRRPVSASAKRRAARLGRFTSLSASAADVNAFISIVSTILLKYNGNNISKITPHLQKWYAQAKPFLDERPDVASKLTSCYNVTTLGRAVKDEQIQALALAMKDKAFQKFLDGSIKVTKPQISFIKLLANHTLADTQEKVDNTWERIRPMVSSLNHPSLNVAFSSKLDKKGNAIKEKDTPVPKEVQKAASECAAIVKSVAGRSNCYLTMREMSNLRTTNVALFSRYAALNKVVNTLAVATIKKLILQSGQEYVDLDVLIKQMQSKGIQNNLPVGFVGGKMAVIANKLTAFTAAGSQLDRLPTGTVRMNPKYDPATDNTFVCMGVGDDKIRYRTMGMKKARRGSHFKNVEHYTKNKDTFRQSWLKDLMKFDPKKDLGRPDRTVVLAALVELLQATSQRIGGKDNKTAGEETFGLTTLKVSHLTIKQSYIEYSYAGKKSATQTSKMSIIGSPEHIRLGQVLRALVEERVDKKGKKIAAKKPNDLVFTWRAAALDKPVTDGAVRKYMAEDHELPMGPHGFRHSLATEMAVAILAKSKFKPGKATQKEVDAWVKEQFKQIGKKLHHRDTKGEVTGVTSIASYVDPSVMHKFYAKLGLRTLKGVPNIDEADDE